MDLFIHVSVLLRRKTVFGGGGQLGTTKVWEGQQQTPTTEMWAWGKTVPFVADKQVIPKRFARYIESTFFTQSIHCLKCGLGAG